MKKIILLPLLLCGFFAQAQILNAGFESVTANKPDNYNLGFYSTYYIKDTNDAYAGTKAAFIKGFGAQSYSVQGAVLGLFSTSGQPAALNGWYKCGIVTGDSLVFSPYVYQTTVTSPKAQGYTFETLSTAVYKQFSSPINYANFPGSSVDTVFISIYLSGVNVDAENINIPQTGTWAMIDDISLGVLIGTGVNEEKGIADMEKVYPQPATSQAYIVYTISGSAACTLKLFDVTGKEVKTIFTDEKQTPGRYKAELNIENLSAGIYFAKLSAGNQTRVAKLVKQ